MDRILSAELTRVAAHQLPTAGTSLDSLDHVRRLLTLVVAAVIYCTACTTSRAVVAPAPHVAPPTVLAAQEGLASFYGREFHQKLAASGIPFNMHALVAAHPRYPFGTIVRVWNLGNGRSVTVKIIDRGPAAGPRADGVIIDLSQRAAEVLHMIRDGRTRVQLQVLRWGRAIERTSGFGE